MNDDTQRELEAIRVIVEALQPFDHERRRVLMDTARVMLGLATYARLTKGAE